MLRKPILLLTVVLLFSTSSLHATPEKSIHIREILIGTNETSYFSLVMIWHHPGSYYKSTELVALREYSLKNEKLIAQTIIRETDYEADSNERTRLKKMKRFRVTSI